jgi:hypothetical protein
MLSVDEKSQIQTLDRTSSRSAAQARQGRHHYHHYHHYLHNGITILFAVPNVLEGTVIGRCMQSHRHQELLRFPSTIEGAVPAGK